MPTIKAIIEKMKTQPNGIKFSEARRVLESNNYALVRTKGSHAHFRNNKGDVITVKMNNPLAAVYVKDILKRVGEKND